MQLTIQPTIIETKNEVKDIDLLARNRDLAEALGLIASYYYIARDTYRARTYSNASAKIAEYPRGIESGAQARAEIKGIGDSVEADINEYLSNYDEETGTGTIRRLQDLEARFINQRQVIDFFRSIYGIGPVTAVKFYNLGYRTLEDLWFKANLTEAQKIGIIWREHINLRIPRAEMDLINGKIGSILDPYGIKWVIAGSYRRQEPSSGDIDVLVESRPDLNMYGLVQLLQPYLPATLAMGPSKFLGIFKLDEQHNGHRIDLLVINPESYAAATMYFTGSQRFNILMRQRAIERGLTLNEYGLYNNTYLPQHVSTQGQLVPFQINTEEDIFTILGVRYIPPEGRTKTLNNLEYIDTPPRLTLIR